MERRRKKKQINTEQNCRLYRPFQYTTVAMAFSDRSDRVSQNHIVGRFGDPFVSNNIGYETECKHTVQGDLLHGSACILCSRNQSWLMVVVNCRTILPSADSYGVHFTKEQGIPRWSVDLLVNCTAAHAAEDAVREAVSTETPLSALRVIVQNVGEGTDSHLVLHWSQITTGSHCLKTRKMEGTVAVKTAVIWRRCRSRRLILAAILWLLG